MSDGRRRRPTDGVPAVLDHVDSAWNRAVQVARHGDPFSCRSEWQLSFHDVFAPQRSLHVETSGDAAIAFAGRVDARIGTLLEPVEASWLFGCPLLGDGATDMLRALVERTCRPTFGPPHVLVSGILPRGRLRHDLARAFRGSHEAMLLQPTELAIASLRGGLDGWLSRRSARVRRNVRAAARRAHDNGVVFERHAPRTVEAADAVYRRMLAIEESSWKGIGRCGMAEPPSRQFYALLLRRLAAGGLARVVIARRDPDGDIGFIFGGMHRGIYRGQQFSFRESWRAASLGNVLQLEKVRWLGEQGATRYDMGPMMDYKAHWTESRRTIDAIFLRSRMA